MAISSISLKRVGWIVASLLVIFGLPLMAVVARGGAQGDVVEEANVRLEVRLSERKMRLYDGSRVVRTYDVAIGTPTHPTPTGDYRIERIIWNPDWVPPDRPWARGETRKSPGDPANPMQGAKIFFRYPTYYIHGTNAPGSVGTAASHGCLRMRVSEVEELAERLQKAGGEDRGGAWFERVKRSKTLHTTVRLKRPISIAIRP